jgi:UDP-N-acetylglucosamine 2-epimerase (non-hydrolysing)
MLDQALNVFGIEPDFDFDLMRENQTLSEIFASIFLAFNQYLIAQSPDLVIIHGDTTTAAAVAQSCFFAQIPFAHIEAGLRTNNLFSPFPEEFNRQLISKLASLHFAPTLGNYDNLIREGVEEARIYVVGNTVVDALEVIKGQISDGSIEFLNRSQRLEKILAFDFNNETFVLVTAHRRENFGLGMQEICSAISELAVEYPRINFVFPVHPNPNVKSLVYERLTKLSNVFLIEPLDYFDFLILLSNCLFVISDSGGIQEEAPSFKKHLILLRDSTERPEVLEMGIAKMVGTDKVKILLEAHSLLRAKDRDSSVDFAINPFGNGDSSQKITNIILDWLDSKNDLG